MATKYTHAVGKRKSAIARVWLKPGKGEVTINKRTIDNYLLRATSKMIVNQPFKLTENEGKYDVVVNVVGGGLSGQAEAIRHGITRALSLLDPENRLSSKSWFSYQRFKEEGKKNFWTTLSKKTFPILKTLSKFFARSPAFQSGFLVQFSKKIFAKAPFLFIG